MSRSTFAIALLLSACGLQGVQAACQLKNMVSEFKTFPGQAECLSTGAGTYTFTMDNDLVSVPTFDGDNALAGTAGNSMFIIFDNACKAVGAYNPTQSNNCGAPYVIEENFLEYVLTITSVNFAVGGGYFSFNYANGKYSIGNNHCICKALPHALEGEEYCGCAFPIHGEKKRTIEFTA